MASIVATKRVRRGKTCKYYSIQFISPIAGQRRTVIYLGYVSRTEAESHKSLIADIVARWNPGLPLPNHIDARVEVLPPKMRKKYQRAGLCAAAQVSRSLDDLIRNFLQNQAVKSATHETYKQATSSLRDVIGGTTPLVAVDAAAAMRWRAEIAKSLAEATCAKRTNVCKAMFAQAVKLGWIAKSPFDGIKSGSQVNPRRSQYVSCATIDSVIASTNDLGWRALIALARYAGLRVPSEISCLRWENVDIAGKTLSVFANKTNTQRQTPIRPQLEAILLELAVQRGISSGPVFPWISQSTNLRTEFQRILKDAGVSPWPRLFQNLRASAETDWAGRYPLHELTAWIGNSPTVAQKHYLIKRSMYFMDATTW